MLPPKFRLSGMSTAIASMEWIFPALRGRPPLSGGRLVAASRWGDRPPTHTVAPDRRGVQIAAACAGSGDWAAAGRGSGTVTVASDSPRADGSQRGDARAYCLRRTEGPVRPTARRDSISGVRWPSVAGGRRGRPAWFRAATRAPDPSGAHDQTGCRHSPTMHQYCWLAGGPFLAHQLVWITASCAPGFAFSWPRASCRQAGRWLTRFFLARLSG